MISRTTITTELVTQLSACLAGLVQDVLSVRVDSLAGRVPLVTVSPKGFMTEKRDFQSDRIQADYLVNVWVQGERTSWTRQQAINRLNDICQKISEMCEEQRETNVWHSIDFLAPSQVVAVEVDGDIYYLETYFLRVT